MSSKTKYVKVCSDHDEEVKPFQAKPLSEVSQRVDAANGADM